MERKFSGSIGIVKKVSAVWFNKNLKVIFLKIFIRGGKSSKTYIPRSTGQGQPAYGSTQLSIIIIQEGLGKPAELPMNLGATG